MGLFKKNGIWQFDFWYKKTRRQGSTGIRNHEAAKLWLSKYKVNLAMTGVGLVEKPPAPNLSDFLDGPFRKHCEQQTKTKGTLEFYKRHLEMLKKHPGFQKPIDQITEVEIQGFKELRLKAGLSVSYINNSIATLRKALIFADKCGFGRYREIHQLPGAKNRIFVVSPELERQYLAAAPYPLKQVAILMLDLGLRPEECVSLRKCDLADAHVTVTRGKTANARRSLPQTERTREVFKLLNAMHPDSEFFFKGHEGKPMVSRSVSNLHTLFRRRLYKTTTSTEVVLDSRITQADRARVNPSRMLTIPTEFVLYSFRHTFATRLAEACNGDLFVLMKALGHSSPLMCAKYVHPTSDYLTLAYKRKEILDKLLRGEGEVTHEDTHSRT